jgi:hypothetical protein
LTALNDATAVVMHDDDIRANLVNVLSETQRQVTKWGIQHHPDGTGGWIAEQRAASAKALTDRKADLGTVTWKDILDEEIQEAFAETDPQALITELLQVAAVAVSWATDVQNRAHPSY